VLVPGESILEVIPAALKHGDEVVEAEVVAEVVEVMVEEVQ
jgi:hypothetical protein